MPTKLPPNNTTLRIAVNGVVHHLDANDLLSKRPYLKLSEYLREDLHLTGTKVACGEGLGMGCCHRGCQQSAAAHREHHPWRY
jgi:aerobic-type carbon monoxide dehydrogenase small subunit (CoxS/CutS family)